MTLFLIVGMSYSFKELLNLNIRTFTCPYGCHRYQVSNFLSFVLIKLNFPVQRNVRLHSGIQLQFTAALLPIDCQERLLSFQQIHLLHQGKTALRSQRLEKALPAFNGINQRSFLILIFLTILQNVNFLWLKIKLPTFSITLENILL